MSALVVVRVAVAPIFVAVYSKVPIGVAVLMSVNVTQLLHGPPKQTACEWAMEWIVCLG